MNFLDPLHFFSREFIATETAHQRCRFNSFGALRACLTSGAAPDQRANDKQDDDEDDQPVPDAQGTHEILG
jgi:hypothetical protein